MHGDNGTPETPDWQPRRIATGCTNCLMSRNFCDCNQHINGEPCCDRCTHQPTPVKGWDGDQA